MVINRKYKFIFVHIPKAAGTFIRTMLLRHSPGSYKYKLSHVPISRGERHLSRQGEDPSSYFKFLSVRNPFSWYVSLYEHGRAGNAHEWWQLGYGLNENVSFEVWLRKLLAIPGSDLQFKQDERPTTQNLLAVQDSTLKVGWLTHRLIRSSFPVTLAEKSFREGTLLEWQDPRNRIDMVLHTEQVRNDLLAQDGVLGIQPRSRAAIRDQPRINKRKHKPASTYYTPELQQLVAEKDKYIFEGFGYDTIC